MPPRKRYRCRFCGAMLNAYLPWAKAPNSALLLGHLGQQHLEEVRPYLQRMETKCIDAVLNELYEMIEGEEAIWGRWHLHASHHYSTASWPGWPKTRSARVAPWAP